MALQLTGAAKPDSIANMQVRLPVVVIGGGLTAIDTATESLAYYPLQVEKFLSRYDALAAARGEAAVRAAWTAEETAIADEFLAHARAIRAERAAAARDGRDARIAELVQSWGGVTIAYRRRLSRQPVLHAEPRGGGEGAGGGHPLRGRADAGRGSTSTGTTAPVRSRCRCSTTTATAFGTRPGGQHARADDPGRRGYATEHRARARGRRSLPRRRQVLPAAGRVRRAPASGPGPRQAGSAGCADRASRGRRARSVSSATCIPRGPATW